MSKRAQIRAREQQRKRKRRLTIIGLVSAVALVVSGLAIRENSKPIGEIVSVVNSVPDYADGKSLGSIDAPVLVQDFSNFT